MNLLLDTCAMIWCVSDPDRLSVMAQEAVVNPLARIFVSAISCAEIACLVDGGKLDVRPHWRTWFNASVAENGWSVLDIDIDTVQEAFSLPGRFHRDPADRFIVAAARLRRMPVITADRKIIEYPHVETCWE